jgi:hypothetical protein
MRKKYIRWLMLAGQSSGEMLRRMKRGTSEMDGNPSPAPAKTLVSPAKWGEGTAAFFTRQNCPK